MSTDRRSFLQLMTAGAAVGSFTGISRALAIPAHHRTGTIADIEHIVILMQENRSFDHYFGTMRGVRGFGDPRAVKLPSGAPVWQQPNGSGYLAPYHPDAPNLGLAFMEGTPHNWPDAHQAWNKGKYDQWIAAKGTTTMAYLTRDDIPYHFALADAFTVCDAYYCSFMGATDPNRYHMWTGWVGNDGQNGGPVVDNSEAGYDWSTYPERLQRAGISWKIYQDAGAGLDAEHFWGWGSNPYIGNYGDNSLLYFHQYQNALPGSPLHQGARTATDISKGDTLFEQLEADVRTGKLPQVSWVVAPESYTEHANWPPNYGAWYISAVLDALTSNPEVWSKTAFLVNYDENDGLFDHMVPPTPPATRAEGVSTVPITNEIFPGTARYAAGPYGFGPRVPMVVISPWSKGGWVNSETFDHTSIIRFIERRFAKSNPDLIEANITPWRRAVAGDLTSAFNFKTPNAKKVTLPSTAAYAPPDRDWHADYKPTPLVQELPAQEPGLRPARPVPYEPHVRAETDVARRSVSLNFGNGGKGAAVFQVRAPGGEGPWTYTVGPDAGVSDSWTFKPEQTGYDLAVHGPNGFYRGFRGSFGDKAANLLVRTLYAGCGITVHVINRGKSTKLAIYDAYTKKTIMHALGSGDSLTRRWSLDKSHGWYDLTLEVKTDPTFQQRVAGHVETGDDSMSDPLLGGC